MEFMVTLITALLTNIGVLIAYIEFIRRDINSKKQIIKTLKNQLETTGQWAQATGPGYVGHPSDKEKIDWATNPFGFIYETRAEVLESIFLKEGIISFSDEFLGKLFEYNQNISRIKNIVDFQKNIVANNYPSALSLEEKGKNYKNKINSVSWNWNKFLSTLSNRGEARLAELIAEYNEVIHYVVIGGPKSNGMKEQHDTLKKEIDEKEKELFKISVFQTVIFTILFDLLFQLLIYVFKLDISYQQNLLISFIVAFALMVKLKACKNIEFVL